MAVIDNDAMLEAVRRALYENPADVVSVSLPDGTSVRIDRKQAMAEMLFWERRAAGGGMRTIRTIPPGAD